MALEAALGEVGRTSTDAVDAFVEHLEHRMGPHHGARVVARAWVDPAFKERLLADGTAAVAELGIAGAEGDNVRVVENTDHVHNLVVCTLCSCYPWPLLGVPPIWYKSFAYRSRAVAEPRGVLARVRVRARRRRRGPRLGLERGDPLSRAAAAAGGDRDDDRGRARRPRHARRDDRRADRHPSAVTERRAEAVGRVGTEGEEAPAQLVPARQP